MATRRQRERIIRLYHQGATFQRAIERIPQGSRNRGLQEGFYEGVATAGQLSPEHARSVLSQCDPPTKAKCTYVLDQIAEDVSVPREEVRTVLRDHFGLPEVPPGS